MSPHGDDMADSSVEVKKEETVDTCEGQIPQTGNDKKTGK